MNQKDISLKKLPPYSQAAEHSILGAIFIENDSISKAIEIIDENDFYVPRNAIIFKTMWGMSWRGEAIDLVTLSENLLRSGNLEIIGGTQYLMGLMETTFTSEMITHHAWIIKNKARLRRIIAISTRLNLEAYEERTSVESLLKRAEQDIYEITESLNEKEKKFNLLGDTLVELYTQLEAIDDPQSINDVSNIIQTGFVDLDELIVGFQSEMIILAGRPGMGKTAFAFGLSTNIAKSGYPVGIFSIETSESKCVERFWCTESKVDSHNIRQGSISKDEWNSLANGLKSLSGLPIYLYDCPKLTLQDFRFKVKKIVKEFGIKIIVLDYIQLMSVEGVRGRSRAEELTEISKGLKSVLREFSIPGIIISQLNREVETRRPPRPILSDLRGSGAIEQEADIVIMLYRHGYYVKKMTEFGGEDLRTEVIVNKNRGGRIGTVKLVFEKKYTRFENIARDGYE